MRLRTNAVIQALTAAMALPLLAQAPATYRARLLGVFDAQSGEPIEGAEVMDMLTKTFATTTKTGTVTLVFLPDGGSLVRVRKVGYAPTTLMAAISSADTVPLTVLLSAAQTLPTVVTTDSAPKYLSPGLRAFDERRKQGFGHFITDAELRKQEFRNMTNAVRQLPGLVIVCPTRGFKAGTCFAQSTRQGCPPDIYVDGVLSTDNDLEKLKVMDFSGVEWYAGGATMPSQYNTRNSSCGVLLLWSRIR